MTRILVALGGNAIQRARDAGTWSDAIRQMRRTARALVAVVRAGHELVLTHGNGPQVGDLLREAELGAAEIPPPPMHVLDAETEGQIGFLIAQELGRALARARLSRTVLPIVSRTEVARADPAFRAPAKPVGRFYSAAEAKRLASLHGWTMRVDPARGGWRRVVASPRPRRWLEGEAVRSALDAGLGRSSVLVVSGGGGIPVVRSQNGGFDGVDAVVDKDRAAAVVARQLGATTLAIVTDVPGAAVGFRGPRPEWLGNVTAGRLSALLAAGEFAEGSMGPKVGAGLDFLRAGGRYFVITDVRSLPRALRGEAGTRVGRPG